MKKHILSYIFAIIAISSIFGCADSGVDPDFLIKLYNSDYKISVDASSLDFASSSSAKTFSITTNDEWVVSNPNSWVKLSASQGSGNSILSVSVDENQGSSERVGRITITGKFGNQSISIDVKQAGKKFNVSPQYLDFGAGANTMSVKVSADGLYTVSKDEDWILVSVNGEYVEISVTQNNSKDSRTGNVIVSLITDDDTNRIEAKISVSQSGSESSMTVNPESFKLKSSTDPQTLSINTDASWTLSQDQPWVFFGTSSGTGSQEVTFIVQENKTPDARTAIITLQTENGEITIPISIEQSGKMLNLSTDKVSFSNQKGTEDVLVETDGTFSVSKDVDWLLYEPYADKIKIVAEENPGAAARTGVLTVFLTGLAEGTSLEKELVVTQAGYEMTVSPTSLSASSEKYSSTITISSKETWTVKTSDSWIAVSKNTGKNEETIDVSLASNTNPTTRKGTITITGAVSGSKEVSVEQLGLGYHLDLNKSNISFEAAGGKDSFAIKSDDKWEVSSADSWVTLSPTSGSADGEVIVTVAENKSEDSRTGKITVKGVNTDARTISVSQAGITYAINLSKTDILVSAESATETIDVTSNDTWSVKASDSWITVKPESGIGNGKFDISISANTGATSRSGNVTVTGAKSGSSTIKVSQSGAGYSLSIDKSEISAKSSASTESITVTTNDDWSVKASDSWITVKPASGSGNGKFEISLSENAGADSRSGSVTITGANAGSTSVSIRQSGVGYALSVDKSEVSAKSVATSETISVSSNDSWSVSASDSWISVAPSSGSGNGTFEVNLSENAGATSRSGSVTVSGSNAGTTTISISQSGVGYNLSVDKTKFNAKYVSTTETISVTTNDSWSVKASENWITVKPASGSGNGKFEISLTENTGATSRSGSVTVTGASAGTTTISISQDGVGYSLTVDKSSFQAKLLAATEKITVTSNDDWTVKSSDSWITVKPSSGSGNGTFEISVSANNGATSRSGSVTVTGANTGTTTISVSQDGIGYSLTVDKTAINAKSVATTESVSVTANESWNVTASDSWITVKPASGSGNGSFDLSLSANTSPSSRSGSVTVSGANEGTATISINQSGVGYSLSVDKSEISAKSSSATESVSITTNDDWSVTASDSWITVKPSSGSGDGKFDISISANTGATSRSGSVTVTGTNSGSTTIKISQSGVGYSLSVDKSEISAKSSSATESVSITTNDDWSVTASDSWITVKPSSGSGDGKFDISISANTGATSRSGSVTVTGTNSGSTTIKISQSGVGYSLSVDKSEISAKSSSATESVSVTTNDDWSVTSSDSWITVKPSSGSGDGKFDISLSANTGATSRSGSVTVTGTNTGSTTIKISQSGVGYSLSVDKSEINVQASAATETINVTSNDNWTVEISDSWIKCNTESGTGNGKISIEIAENLDVKPRDTSVVISGNNSSKQIITIHQGGAVNINFNDYGNENKW